MGDAHLEFLKIPTDTTIPVPQIEGLPTDQHLKKDLQPVTDKQRPMEKTKYEREYDAFCHWAALPKDVRKPKKLMEFEKAWKLPKNYTAYFRQREDYQEKRTKYFYDWLMDLWPDAVYAAYNRAMRSSTADFKVLAEIISKNLDVSKPKVTVTPMLLVGVSSEKINKLMEPKPVQPIQQAEIVKDS